jgi:CrcB protein
LVSSWFLQRVGAGFPWGTFTINVTGSFAIGIVLQLALSRLGLNPYVRLFFATGILGGYTTFSTYAFEIYSLGSSALPVESVLYALGSIIAGVAAAFAGTLLVRTFAT